MKVALVYDRVNKWGGAERVLLTLHEMFPEAPLYTSVCDLRKASWAKVFPRIITSFLQKFPFAKNNHQFYAPLMPFVFESFNFSAYDLVISVTSEAAKGIITNSKTKHICYCLTPTRYLWSGYKGYFTNKFLRLISHKIVAYLRSWDKIAAQRPDKMLAISSEVKDRIRKYYDLDSVVIFPPVEVKRLENLNKDKGHFFLIVSRLVSYKRVDLAIQAFNKLGLPLIIVGTGLQKMRLKLMAKKNIRFVGFVDEKKLAQYYCGAKALVMPQLEDFGIVAVEAQSFGVPVIAYYKGGSKDTVINGKTGITFLNQKVDSLVSAVGQFEKTVFDRSYLLANASRFSKENFKKELFKIING
jgi:glycosyltransferase involved in cell wall biosynthesis